MSTDLSQQAIEEAISGNWKVALKLNLEILSQDPKNTDALNRLSRAYYELGNCKKAQTTTKKVLRLDPLNQIAIKCSVKYKKVKTNTKSQLPEITSFIEIPGKTKTIPLVNLGDKENLSSLCPGEKVKMKIGSHRVTIQNTNGTYLGKIPDNIAAIIISQKTKNTPSAFIKSYSKGELNIFLYLTNDEQIFPQI